MNKHQVSGRVDQSTGKIKELAGKLVGNENLEAEGLAEQAKGKLQASYGDTKEKAKDKVKKAIDSL
jgi:uncharacterized protein YjbJ (UPF0337 family)